MGIFIKNNCDCCPPSVCEPCDVCAATSGTGTLYYNDALGSDENWQAVGNWWQDAAATIPALAAPWCPWYYDVPQRGVCVPYYNYNLTFATGYGGGGPVNDLVVAGGGTCDMSGVENNGYIYSGTFTGDRFWNDYGVIWDGTYTGDTFYNDSDIHGGTFSSSNFINAGFIDGGLFQNSGFTNYSTYRPGYIVGGTWAGSGFVNDDGYVCAPSWPIQTC